MRREVAGDLFLFGSDKEQNKTQFYFQFYFGLVIFALEYILATNYLLLEYCWHCK